MKFKMDFITNSSSTSFVVINARDGYYFPHFDSVLIVDDALGATEFGWGPATIRDLGSRINFAYLQTNFGKREKWLNMLEEVIMENTDVKSIIWNLSDEYDSTDKTWAYIDHQSSASEGENTEIFDSKDMLKDFIFGKRSCIVLDNDNY